MSTEGLRPPQSSQEPLDFNISKQAAEASYSKELVEGEVVSIERSDVVKSRAMAIGGVYTESVGKHMGWVGDAVTAFINWKEQRPVFVKMQTPDGKNLYLNVNSLSKRLEIPKDKILEAARVDGMSGSSAAVRALILKHAVPYQERQQRSTAVFSKIQAQYASQNKTPDADRLRKAIHITLISGFEKGQVEQAAYKLSEGTLLHLSKQPKGEFPLMTEITKEKLGEGGFGIVQSAKVLSTGEEAAMKTVHDAETLQKNKKASDIEQKKKPTAYSPAELEKVIQSKQKETKDEYNIIAKIHERCEEKGISTRGIQQKLTQQIDYEFEGKEYKGHMGPRYESDLLNDANNATPTPTYVKNCAFDLLSGLCAMSQANIAHGDIKLENCLVKTKPDGTKEFFLADFGGAADLDESLDWPVTRSLRYFNQADEDKYEKWEREAEVKLEEFDKLNEGIESASEQQILECARQLNDLSDKMHDVILKRDVYATGCLLDMLLKHQIDKSDEDGTEKFRISEAKALRAIIAKMKHPDSDKRITAEAALTEYKTMFKIP